MVNYCITAFSFIVIFFLLVCFFTDEERIGAKRKKNVQHFGNFFGDEGGAGFEGRGKGNFFRQSMFLNL